MFNNYLILKEKNINTLYLFINNYKSFKKFYKYFKNKNKNKLIKKIKFFLKDNNEEFKKGKITFVIEGVITQSIYI